jgi:hypothetical protein
MYIKGLLLTVDDDDDDDDTEARHLAVSSERY